MSRRGNNPSRAERTQRRAAERVRRERKAMQIPDAIRALTEDPEPEPGPPPVIEGQLDLGDLFDLAGGGRA